MGRQNNAFAGFPAIGSLLVLGIGILGFLPSAQAQTNIPRDSQDLIAKLREFRLEQEANLQGALVALRAPVIATLEQDLQQESQKGNLDASVKIRSKIQELGENQSRIADTTASVGLPVNSRRAMDNYVSLSKRVRETTSSELLEKSTAVSDILDSHILRETQNGNIESAVELRRVSEELRNEMIAASNKIASKDQIIINETFYIPPKELWETTSDIQFIDHDVHAYGNFQKLSLSQPISDDFRVTMKVRLEGKHRNGAWDFSIQLVKPNVQGFLRFDKQNSDHIGFATDKPENRYRGDIGKDLRTVGTEGTVIVERRGESLTLGFVNRRGQKLSASTTVDTFDQTQLVFWLAGQKQSPRIVEQITITAL
jgi:hypothetical protein